MKNLVTGLILSFFVLVTAPALFAQNAVIYDEIFNSATPPAGWHVVNNDGSLPDQNGEETAWLYVQQVTFQQTGQTVDPQAGESFWFSNFTNANSAGLIDEWLISPRITGVEQGDTLIFYAGAIDDQFKDSLRVFISTTDDSLSSFQEIAKIKVNGPIGTYTRYAFTLSDTSLHFTGEGAYVAVDYYIVNGGPNGANSNNVWVDHFIIKGAVTGIADEPVVVKQFQLEQNYPNPFNPSTRIAFTLAKRTVASLKVYNAIGQEVAILIKDADLAPGRHSYEFDASRLPTGTYYYRLESGEGASTRKMILLR